MAITLSNPLSQEQIHFYNENGYLVLEGMYSPAECDTLLGVLKASADEKFSAILNLDRRVPAVRDAMKDPRIVSVLETLQGGELSGLMTQVLFKEAGSPYAKQAWNPHQDNAYPRARKGAFITINLFLADSDRETGCLYIYPGSHNEDLLPDAPTKSYREDPGTNPGNTVDLPEKYKGKEREVIVPKGGMLVLHGNVVHGSYPNMSLTRSRPVFQATYILKGENFIPGKNANRTEIPLR